MAFLLASTLLFWMWQSVIPVFDKRLPFLNAHDGVIHLSSAKEVESAARGGIVISLSEVVALYVGVATIVSAYGLFWASSDGKASFWQTLTFIVSATWTSLGNGMHTVCVIAQYQISRDNPLYLLLDFVHERWSHYMFQSGMFCILIVIMWVERPHLPPTNSTNQIRAASWLSKVWLSFLGPLLTALFTAVFSNRTETGSIATGFYISVILSCFVVYVKHYSSISIWDIVFGEKFLTVRYFIIVAVLGLPTLLIHYFWLM